MKPKTCRVCSGVPNGSASNNGPCIQKCLEPASNLGYANLKAKVNQTEIILDLLVPYFQVVFILNCSQHIFIIANVTGRYVETEKRAGFL